jgi:fatty-acyl-CoA synthase
MKTSSDLDRQVLDIVNELVAELRGAKSSRPSLDDSLDRDLGISSLERVELLLRLERAFGVRLADEVMAEAATPRDLVAALLRAAPDAAEPSSSPRTPAAGWTTVPATARSLADAVRWHTERTPDRVHLYLRTDEGRETPITYGELMAASSRVGAGLQAHGVGKGDRVALMLRTERAFFDTFLGTLLIGAVPVPLYPPLRAEDLLAYTRRQQAILRNAGARVLVAFDEVERLAALMRGALPDLQSVTTAGRLASQSSAPALDYPAPDDPALIQYTSGSTGDPKGVLLSHGNILANVRAIGEALGIGSDDVGVSWLPLYHDMGLIGLWLGALYFGAPAAIMSPLAFLSRPARWLWAVHAHRGTISAAPNFAFDLCARRIADDEIQGLDLSSWRVAVNGAEAVNPDTIERFTRRFAAYGFRPEAMRPAYGLAESSVALAFPRAAREPRVDRIAREPFERARKIRAAAPDDPHPMRFVSCGVPVAGHEVRIVGTEDRTLGDRAEGRIQFRGPSVTRGYFRNPSATAAAFRDGWMDSGDLGYWADGELFVTGREKDLIIQAGRNVSAEEVERIAGSVPGVRAGCVAAFGVPDPSAGTERLVVVAETRERDPPRCEALQGAIRERLVEELGGPPDVVVMARPRTVPKTPSGKIRRNAMREAYVTGTMGPPPAPLWQRLGLVAAAAGPWAGRLSNVLVRLLFTGWIAIVLLLTVPVLWAYVALWRRGDATRASARWSRLVFAVCGLRPRVVGAEHLEENASAILTANHASYLDPLVLLAALPGGFRFAAKRGLLRYPLIGTVIRRGGHATIERAGLTNRLAGAEAVAERLRAGERLVVFPEGTFAREDRLLPFRLGAFRAAVETGRAVIPVAIEGTRQVLPDGTWLFRRRPIVVTIAAPIAPQAQGWPEIVRLRDAAVDVIRRTCAAATRSAD